MAVIYIANIFWPVIGYRIFGWIGPCVPQQRVEVGLTEISRKANKENIGHVNKEDTIVGFVFR